MTDQREEQPPGADGANEEILESDLPLIDLETEEKRPPSRRKRAAQISLALVAAAIVLVTFWQVAFPARPAPPAPKPLPPPMVLITSDVNYGLLTINGKRQQVKLPFLFQAQNTAYTVTLEPAPLRAHSCHFNFISSAMNITSSDGRCFGGPATYRLPNGTPGPTSHSFALEMFFTTDDLPPGQADQIETLLSEQPGITQTIAVPAGSYYATGITSDGAVSSQQATTALQGTAIRAPDLASAQLSCAERLCPTNLDWNSISQLSGQVWIIGLPVALRWQFATLAGNVISDVSYPTADFPDVFLTYDTATGWRIQPEAIVPALTPLDQVGNLDCATGTMLAQQLIQRLNPQFLFSLETSYHRQLSGCEIVPRDSGDTAHGKLIWRFGVLLAGDESAQTLLPNLPLAPPDEIAAIEG
ncbi:MAG TPA: hypothetical protein VFU32_09555 [Ktedonobacterales bacterium]|nr:hypothetical protein [Ktedonobacterales bacterium]